MNTTRENLVISKAIASSMVKTEVQKAVEAKMLPIVTSLLTQYQPDKSRFDTVRSLRTIGFIIAHVGPRTVFSTNKDASR